MLSKMYCGCLSLLLSFCFINCDNNPELDSFITQEFIYMQGLCCQNLQSINTIDLPEECKPDFDLFYGINLEAFSIAENYDFGDTLSISWVFTDECEAQGDQYDCNISCDMRHGVPIKITSID